jgi:hypothetical protein
MATPDDLLAAIDKETEAVRDLTRAIRAMMGAAGGQKDKAAGGPEWSQQAGSAAGDVNEGMYAAGDISSGSVGRTIRGLRSAYKLYQKYGGKGGAGAGEAGGAAEGAAGAGAEGMVAEGGGAAAGGGEAAAAAGAGGAAAAAGPIGLAVLAVVAVLAGLVLAFKKFKNHVEETTEELVQFQSKFAEVSGAMANVYAQREMRELQRDRQMGDRLANSARYLTEGEQARKDKEASFTVLGTKIQNYLEGFGNRFLAGLYDPFSKLADRLDKLIDQLTGEKTPEQLGDWIQRIEDKQKVMLDNGKQQRQKAAAAVDLGRGIVPRGR